MAKAKKKIKNLASKILDIPKRSEPINKARARVESMKSEISIKIDNDSGIRAKIKELALLRRDASQVWDTVRDDKHSDEDIRELIRSEGFGKLLQNIS